MFVFFVFAFIAGFQFVLILVRFLLMRGGGEAGSGGGCGGAKGGRERGREG